MIFLFSSHKLTHYSNADDVQVSFWLQFITEQFIDILKCVAIKLNGSFHSLSQCILGDPGADSGGDGKSIRTEK